jgi:hypothetical protein
MPKKKIIIVLVIIILVLIAVGIFLIEYEVPNRPSIPNNLTATTLSTTRIDLEWTKGENADTTYIERNLVSSWEMGEGILIYNDTGVSFIDLRLSENIYYYQAWSWNQTNHIFSDNFATTFNTTDINLPPIFTLATPYNGSLNNPIFLDWNVLIKDPQGDSFTWTIQCNNGQQNNATDANNGTKTLTLTNLEYSTTYTIWVNATDPTGSNQYTRRWYKLTTEQGNPIFGIPTPNNRSTGHPQTLTWSIPINDPQGDPFTWTIQCNNGQQNNATDANNGTKTLTLTNLEYSTTYTIWVNATDPTGSNQYTRRWYKLTTEQEQNLPPNKPIKPSGQINGKVRQEFTYTTSTTDPNGDQVYYIWDWGDGKNSGWLGPYNSGVTINTTHSWTFRGSYNIRVKAKDIYGEESSWSDPLAITMPFSFNKPTLKLLELFFQRFSNTFPKIQQLFGY